MMFATPKSLFRVLAFAEAVTWTLLISGLILRATIGLDVAVSIGGGIHGLVFLTYGATAVLLTVNQRWNVGTAVLTIGSAIIPYATIPVELWLARSGRLAGEWRTEASDHPRDAGWVDRAMRWFLKHPYILLALIAGAVVLLFVVLLIIGPPGGSK
jgi:integral membrane protein